MNKQGMLSGIVIVMVLLIMAGGFAKAQGPEPPGESVQPQGSVDSQDAASAPLSASVGAAPLAALGTGFTYQGQLKQGDNPVNDTCDFRFVLYDAEVGGSQVGPIQEKTDVNVANGYFTIPNLDFGSGAFQGDARWLEIAVRCPAGGGDYTTLAPRQALTAAPYALFSKAAPWTGLSGVPAGFADNTDNDVLGGLSCTDGQVAKWNGSAWTCATDSDTTYSAGTGLTLEGTEFRIDTTYQLPQGCNTGQIAAWDLETSSWHCTNAAAGDITAVLAGTGLSGGGYDGEVTLSADTTYLQQRVSGNCAAGNAIRVINADGTVTCEPDDNTTYTAGTGLTLAGTQFSLDTAYTDGRYWKLGGNSLSSEGSLGSLTNYALNFLVNNQRALRLEPNADSPNLIGGYSGNTVTSGVMGATIGGGGASGNTNRVTDHYGTVGGGRNNPAGDDAGTTSDAFYATVGGGRGNTAADDYATVSGGAYNGASARYATAGGGYDNEASGEYSTAGGGYSNSVTGRAATVGGGYDNAASGEYGTVGGGYSNSVTEPYATVGGGKQNIARGSHATVGGGAYNSARAAYATIAGGGPSDTADPLNTNNRVYDNYGTIGGGGGNWVGSEDGDPTSAFYATVGGGRENRATDLASTVCGGWWNEASGGFSTVGGGWYNIAGGSGANVDGGYENIANGSGATVGGGAINAAIGYHATVGGGEQNIASGDYATIPGGGYARATHYGEMAYASGMFTAYGDAQTSVYVLRNTSSGTGLTELFMDGSSARLTIASGRTVTFDILIVGREDDNGESAGYSIRGVIENVSGATAIIGSVSKTVLGEDDTTWDVTVDADGTNDALRIRVQGGTGDTVRWVATVRTAEVSW